MSDQTDAERLAEIENFTFQIESDMDRRYEADMDDVRGLIADARWLIDQLKMWIADAEYWYDLDQGRVGRKPGIHERWPEEL